MQCARRFSPLFLRGSDRVALLNVHVVAGVVSSFQPRVVASSVTRTGRKGCLPLPWPHWYRVVENLEGRWAVTREAEVCWVTLRLPQGTKTP